MIDGADTLLRAYEKGDHHPQTAPERHGLRCLSLASRALTDRKPSIGDSWAFRW